MHHRFALATATTTIGGNFAGSETMSRRTCERYRGRCRSRGQRRAGKKSVVTNTSWMSALLALAIMSVILLRSAVKHDTRISLTSIRNTFGQTINRTIQQKEINKPVEPLGVIPQRPRVTTQNIRRRIARSKLKRKAIWRQRHSRIVKRTLHAALSPLPLRTGRQSVVRDHVGRIIEPASPRDVADERTHMASKVKVSKQEQGKGKKKLANNHGAAKQTKTAGTLSSKTNKLGGTGKVMNDKTFSHSIRENSKSNSGKDIRVNKEKKDRKKTSDFQGCTGGTHDGMIRGQNVTRICYSVYKIMRLFGFASLTDSPAGSHAEWMGELTSRLAFEQPMFRYIGTDADANALANVRSNVTGAGVDGDFEIRDVETGFSGATDVLLHWTELDESPRDPHHKEYPNHIRAVLRAARRANIGYAIIAQYPRFKDATPSYRNGKWVFLGKYTSESPFLFNDDVRGAVPVEAGTQTYLLYLTFYSLRSMTQLDG